jgi:hypothetical protein
MLCSREDWENDWVELLSQLEYVGCRKIIKAVPFERVNREVLQHLAEEASHAFLLKSAIAKIGWPDRPWQAASLSAAGWDYFQTLDRAVSSWCDDTVSPYPSVSWIVEQRVLVIYPLYKELTAHDPIRRAVSTILAQEERHGKQFDALPALQPLQQKMVALERTLWEKFERSVSLVLGFAQQEAVPPWQTLQNLSIP